MISLLSALSLPDWGALDWGDIAYYAGCGFAFFTIGFATGYFIWRRGHMQLIDAENEVKNAADQLNRLQDDLKLEKSNLGDSEN